MNYPKRRAKLHESLGNDNRPILFLGHHLQPRNYPANPYTPFRQNSHFLYYFGITSPDFVAISWPNGEADIFGHPVDMDTIVWEGAQTTLEEHTEQSGATRAHSRSELKAFLQAKTLGHLDDILYIKPYHADLVLELMDWFAATSAEVTAKASRPLAIAICEQRAKKTPEEIAEIETALALTREIFHACYHMADASLRETDLAGHVMARITAEKSDLAFPPIITTHGEILHYHPTLAPLEAGKLLLMDMGVCSPKGYASDITRTFPVDGKYTQKQGDIYDIVLASQKKAIALSVPGRTYKEVHLAACRVIVEGLKSVGLMKGDVDEAVQAGAHALFFPHGLGHMLGLDVHDMEDLGDIVGYGVDENGDILPRSKQFGLNFLRFARELEPGFVMTVEPGIYFIPALIGAWQKEQKHQDFICYDTVQSYLNFGGIRIEDDIFITEEGNDVLGETILKEAGDIENIMQK